MPAIDERAVVGDVLDRYPATLEIFVEFGFKPLRNRLMRKAMAPLVTIAGACKIKGLDEADRQRLLKALNAATGNPQEPLPDEPEDANPLAGATIERDGNEWRIDNRGLEPPEPMTRILHLLQEIGEHDVIVARNDREPIFLYRRLDVMGYLHGAEPCEDGSFRIRIWKDPDQGQPAGT